MATETSDRAFVLGLDGVPWDLIETWVREGRLVNFARLIEEGTAGPLESTVPPTTPLAWPTIATGVSPDKHGIYGFQKLRSNYTHRMYNRTDVDQPELWDVLSPAVVANVPMTYPVEEIDGTFVAGMLSPELDERFAHPPELVDEVRAEIPDYRIGLPWEEYRDRPQEFRDDLATMLDARRSLMRRLMDVEDWRLFFFVYTAPDRLQHLIWEENVLFETYRRLDEILGEVMEYVAGRDATLFVVSDHGFGPIDRYVYLNTLLEREGYLTRKDSGARGVLGRLGLTKSRMRAAMSLLGVDDYSLVDRVPESLVSSVAARVPGDHGLYDVDFSETVAFAHGPGNVYVNDTERFDDGVVDPGAVDQYKREIRDVLESLSDPETGEQVLEVRDGDDVFPTDEQSPDLVVDGVDGYETGKALTDGVFSTEGAVASHRSTGIFLAWGQNVERGAAPTDADVTDVAPTVLHAVGESVPENADGRVLREIFVPDSAPGQRPVTRQSYADTGTDDEVDADFDGVEDRLRGLGYME